MRDMKRVTLELGGKAPMVMFDDMDLDLLGAATAIGSFFNTGQTLLRRCAHLRSAWYLRKGAGEAITGIARSLAIGTGLDPRHQINPLVSSRHQAHVKACIARGIAEGATPLIGGQVRRATAFM